MSALPPIPPNIEEIAAPLLLGTIWNWCLYGALVVQVYVYSYNFPGDRRPIKLLVYGIFFTETLQTALSGADLYYWFVSGFGNMNHLAAPYASAFDVPILGSVVSLTVQVFFAYRIWVMGAKKLWCQLLSLLICLCSVVDATAAFAGVPIRTYVGNSSMGDFSRSLRWYVPSTFPAASPLANSSAAQTWLIGNTISDVLIASAMLYYLMLRRARDGHFSNHAIVRIVRLTIETNLVTTTVSLITTLIVAIFPEPQEKSWYVCPTAIIGKLYSNTLLVSLNNRISIRDTKSCAQAGIVRPPAGTYPSSTSRSGGTDIMLGDMEKPPTTLKTHEFRTGNTPQKSFINIG
ncbi:hypothetical protein BJV78DRAFT_1203452 [Lactifluus subvellereus]|nr:hypothetical protein BJV78DRAFT_1203452 [Lactifluus subvellereus]